jgi:ElaA protein
VSSEAVTATLHRSWAADLEPRTLYEILRLRVDVFVVEQECPYPELDGRDLEDSTRHFWVDSADDYVLGYLRLLEDPDGTYRIGRVCTSKSARGLGIGRKLMRAEVQNSPAVLSAQTYAKDFYASFGFVETGDEYLEDGIPHVDMRREPRRAGVTAGR